MHPHISVNSLCFGTAGLSAVIDNVARLGAGAITPDIGQVHTLGVMQSARQLRDAGLAAAALTHRAFAFTTDELAVQGHDRLNRTIDAALEIGAPTIVLTTGGRGALEWKDACQRFADAISPCAERARDAGIRLAVEPTSHLYADASMAHRLSDTAAIARLADIAVTIDLFACWFDADIGEAIAVLAANAALIQVSDYVYGDRALPCRAVPGDGDVPLHRLIPAIVDAGYRGWFDLEVIGPRLLVEGEQAGLARAAAVLGGWLSDL